MHDDLDRRLRAALQQIHQRRDATGPCPDEELLAAYAEGRLPERERPAVEGHLAACDLCLDTVMIQRRLMAAEVPGATAQAAAAAVRGAFAALDLLDLAVRWVRGGVEVVRAAPTLGWAPAMATVRSGEGAVGPVRCTKRIGSLTLTVQVAHEATGYRVAITADGENAVAAGHRISHHREGRELDSLPVGRAPLLFDGLEPGLYTWHLEKGGEVLGDLSVDLRQGEDDE